ncbi:MAG: pyridoxal-dependent decarboxylase [Cyanobacteria bacterium J06631_12]
MLPPDSSFWPDEGLEYALDLLCQPPERSMSLPQSLPEEGIGEILTLETLAPQVFGKAAHLDSPLAIAHMDPPTPWITWAIALWNARLNQNLLHPATAPFATEAEECVISWLTPYFGMGGGHMCSGSTLANITAIWAARDAKDAKRVIASSAAHLSVKKAARLLGLPFEAIPTNSNGQIDPNQLSNLTDACLVLTAGTTATGVIDSLNLAGQAAWTHVDAAWAGPLRLSPTYAPVLEGIDRADSIAISGHKWLFQPKDSAMILFKEPEVANEAISFGGGYLTKPNVGVQGSRGAAAIPLLATMIAWGKRGLIERIDRTMAMANQLAESLSQQAQLSLWAMPKTGVTVFRPTHCSVSELLSHLPPEMLSTCIIDDETWLRSVAANPVADIEAIVHRIQAALQACLST